MKKEKIHKTIRNDVDWLKCCLNQIEIKYKMRILKATLTVCQF